MTVYLLHLTTPLSRGVSPAGKPLQAGHYIGWAKDVAARLKHHADGTGARFMQVCAQRGVDWALARTWEGDQFDRKFERKLKKTKHAPRLCPICNPDALHYAKLENES